MGISKAQIKKKLMQFSSPYKLHLGCGQIRFEGWINLDMDKSLKSPDITCNLKNGIPAPDNSCELIYCEHLLEHLSPVEGVFFLKECYRCLCSGGILRIAMPSLDVLLEKASGNWRDQDWLTWPEYQFIQTRAEMINIFFRWWGHQWLYDREELCRRLREASFVLIRNMEWGKSDVSEFRNRESRKDSLLICEAQKALR